MAKWAHKDGAIKEPSRPMNGDHVVIIGPYGNIWHDGSFPTAEAAEAYLRAFWGASPFEPDEWRLAVATVSMDAMEPSFALPSASADTHPKGGDVKQAPLVSGAIPEGETPDAR